MLESPHLRHVLHSLSWYLAGVRHTDERLIRLEMRTFVRNGRAVVADLSRPQLVNDPGLAAAGIKELPLSDSMIDPHQAVVMTPDALPGLEWSGRRMSAPTPLSARFELAGVVVLADSHGQPDLRRISSLATGDQREWLTFIGHLNRSGRVRAIDSPAHVVQALDRLLGTS